MGAVYSDKVTYFNAEALEKAIKKIGIGKNKLSTMVMGRDASYLSNAITNGRANKEDLKKLCDFLSLDYDSVVIDKPQPETVDKPKSTPKDIVNLDALILGVNQLYQIEKTNSETMKEILEQLRVTNTKINRLENALGQTVSNVIEIKNTTNNNNTAIKEIKSSCNTMQGRLRDMINKFK